MLMIVLILLWLMFIGVGAYIMAPRNHDQDYIVYKKPEKDEV